MSNGLGYDIKYAARSLWRRPGFTAIAVAILSLGIAAVIMTFSALDAVVLRPLPYPEPDRLAWVWSITDRGAENSSSAADYYDFKERCDAFADLGARSVWTPGQLVLNDDGAERVVSSTVSGSLFTTLGVTPLSGRGFAAAEEIDGGPPVVIISHRYWQSRLGEDPAALGSTLHISGSAHTVIGIMPASFGYPRDVDLWLPMRRGGDMESGRGNNNFFMIGRVRHDLTFHEAQAKLEAVAAEIAVEHPSTKAGWSARMLPLHDRIVGSMRPIMMLLISAVAAVLLIVCGNLSSLLLAKVVSQYRELALRSSVGATPWLVSRQILIESLLLAVIGAIVGFLLASAGTNILAGFGHLVPRLESIQVTTSVVLIAALAPLASGFLSGLTPALHGYRLSPAAALRSGHHDTGGSGSLRLRSALVIVQFAVSVVLLIAAGLLVRSLIRISAVDPGMEIDNVLTVDLQLPDDRYPDFAESTSVFIAELLEQIRAVPGVEHAATADQLPMFGGPYNSLYPAGATADKPSDRIPATRRIVSEDFFATLGIPLLHGRTFTTADRPGSPPTTVISRALAEAAFPGTSAVGQTLILPWGDGLPLEVIGVVGNVRDFGLDTELRPSFYLAARQYPDNEVRLAVKSDLPPAGMVAPLRSVIRRLEPQCALYNEGTMEEWCRQSTSAPRFAAGLLSVFAAVALVLSASGLYGVMSFMVSRRSREVGIRIALGARPSEVVRRFLWLGLKTAVAGLFLGLLIAPLVTRLLESILFATTTLDPITYIVVSVVLVSMVLLASVAPALRAAKVAPAHALRRD